MKADTNEHICEIETNRQIQRTDVWLPEEEEGRTGSWGLADANTHSEWINSKVPLHSTRNYSQHSVTNRNGKE